MALGSKFAAFAAKGGHVFFPAGTKPSTSRALIAAAAIGLALTVNAVAPAHAEDHTIYNSSSKQDRLFAKWKQNHPMNNSVASSDPRSFAEKYPHADPNSTFRCTISHSSDTNENTLSNCHP